MKRIFASAVLFLFLTGIAQAETFYVSDEVDIDVRRGQGYDFKIIALIRPGHQVELIKAGDEWSQVKLEDGKEGWMLNRYLTKNRPAGSVLEGLQKGHLQLKEEHSKAINENTIFKDENENLKAVLAQKESELTAAVKSYEALKKNSTQFLEVSGKLEDSNKELSDLKKRNQELETSLSKLENNQITRGLLTGAGILLAGYLTGMISRKKRRRSLL
jgi:SH3 domain protein